ncbi:indolepyruvate oxidoreductase subunit beta family protein [Piscinibacter sp.]|uniref:indolepyruvate oxidoreductase subunit beta family protein n=1 Tax=Piscinibacter sp. TaxID=1903157 RepID=UPI002D1B049B|nr:indolepyruvate oxidoreductase subunit beta family protein [Albitalea sp.]HUG24519.1 indolepyruvate oxidoreductase subunit beta family protein [Albitalea sp.]
MAGTQPIKIAILAMGGEGGGVLADWIVDLGEHNGHIAQTTSVPGVAQRTGATIYYVELYPKAQAERDGGTPVLALMPLPGDVDVVLASELMEAGRAVQRGLVTPDRTTLVASTHRVYSIAEKTALGDGRADSAQLIAHAHAAAKRFVRFDMAQAAEQAGSVISAVMFGALAGTGVLPFSRAQFEATIERGGVGVKPSLKAFGAAYERAGTDEPDVAPAVVSTLPVKAEPRDARVRALLQRIADDFPVGAQPVLIEGVRRLVDYQDPAYAALYLDRLARVAQLPADGEPLLLLETARHLALWMSYEDTIRVAELKTRATRFERVRDEVRVGDGQLVAINEYMHPRLQEICETLPAGLGRWLEGSGWPRRLVERFTRKGRVITTSSLRGFLMLYTVAGMKRWRRGTLRFAAETQRIEQWLAQIAQAAAINPRLAVEVAQCQRLVKGYSDTHARGLRNFEALMAAVQRAGAALAPATLRELRDAALADEHGDKLRATLARHALA